MSTTNLTFLPEIDANLCDGCDQCVTACREQALALVCGKAAVVRPQACLSDGDCELVCPRNAIKVFYLIVFGDDQAED